MSAHGSAEVVALCRAQLAAILKGEADQFGRAWDVEMVGDERQFWCRAAGLGGYAWAYASRMWGEIDPTNRTKIKAAVRRVAGRAALLLNDRGQRGAACGASAAPAGCAADAREERE